MDLNNRYIGKDIGQLEGFPQNILNGNVKEEFFFNNSYYQGHVEQIPDKRGRNKGYVVLILDVT